MICFHAGKLYVLHGFIKKTQKTPDEDLKLALKRKKEIENG
jgi:phage-related protein